MPRDRRREAPPYDDWRTRLRNISFIAFVLGAGLVILEFLKFLSGVTIWGVFLMVPTILMWVLSKREEEEGDGE